MATGRQWILSVDDDLLVLFVWRAALAHVFYACTIDTAQSACEALEKLESMDTGGTENVDLITPGGKHQRERIGFVFQFPSLTPSLTALENVVLPTLFGDGTSNAGAKQSAQNRAAQLLNDVGLAAKLHAYPRQLSGGEQQRVVIARSLINEPDLILADEPTSDLDELTEQEIMHLFRDVHARRGVTILLVTHSLHLGAFGTRAVRMQGGRIVEPDDQG